MQTATRLDDPAGQEICHAAPPWPVAIVAAVTGPELTHIAEATTSPAAQVSLQPPMQPST